MVESSAMAPWWRDAVVYQMYLRSFADGDGDGIGDLAGLTAHLDYLVALGVDAVWLAPCYPSPQHDAGYDVANYFDIDPTYGTLDQFDELVAACRARGLRVMMDIVPNHCSSEHAWFQEALASPPGSAARDRFYFRDGAGENGELPPNNWQSVFGGTVWTRVTEADGSPGQWYLHTFAPEQADLNWDNQDVVEKFDRVLRFWFDRGVEGFRVDAVAVVGKAPGLPDAPPWPADAAENDRWMHNPYSVFWPAAHEIWRRWRRLIDDYQIDHPERSLVTVSEAYTPQRPDLLLQYVAPDEFHGSFCFDLLLSPYEATMMRRSVADVYNVLHGAGAALTWTLNNHDTQRTVTRYGREDATSPASYTGNNLVYTNTAVDEELGRVRSRAVITMTMALPGSVYLFQGEELGLPEVLDIADDDRRDPIFAQTEGRSIGRDGCRIPMPWTVGRDGAHGFSPAAAAEPWLPQPPGWGAYAVEAQDADPASMLNLYRRLAVARRGIDTEAPLDWVLEDSPVIIAFTRGELLVVFNLASTPMVIPAELLGDRRRMVMSSAVDVDHAEATLVEGACIVPADTCIWLAR